LSEVLPVNFKFIYLYLIEQN